MSRLVDKNGTPSFKWNKKSTLVRVGNLDPTLIGYLESLEPDIQNKILATSGNDSGHAKTSRHYNNKAVDLRFDQSIWDRIEKDPNRIKMGITLLNPNHGSGKHIHLSTGSGSENKADVWMNPFSDRAKNLISSLNQQPVIIPEPTPTAQPVEGVQPTGYEGLLNEVKRGNDLYETNLASAQAEVAALRQQKSEMDAYNAEQSRLQDIANKRIQDRNTILDLIQSNDLEGVSRNKGYFADGGEFSLDDDTLYQIEMIKNSPSLNYQMADTSSLDQQLAAAEDRLSQIMSSRPNINITLPAQSVSPTQNVSDVPTPSNTEVADTVVPLSNKDKIIQGLSSSNLGLSKEQIYAGLGFLSGESGENFQSNIKNFQTGRAFGISQWLGPRLQRLRQEANTRGVDASDIDLQVDFLVNELQTTEKRALRKIRESNTLEDAVKQWTLAFGRPSVAEYKGSIGKRIRNANKFFNESK